MKKELERIYKGFPETIWGDKPEHIFFDATNKAYVGTFSSKENIYQVHWDGYSAGYHGLTVLVR